MMFLVLAALGLLGSLLWRERADTTLVYSSLLVEKKEGPDLITVYWSNSFNSHEQQFFCSNTFRNPIPCLVFRLCCSVWLPLSLSFPLHRNWLLSPLPHPNHQCFICLSTNYGWDSSVYTPKRASSVPCFCCCHWITKSCLSLWPCGLQHTRLPHPLLSLRVCSSSCSLSQWYYLTISSSVTLSSFCPQSFPESGSFMNCLFASCGQNIGALALASVFPLNIQGWFPSVLTGLISL